MDLDLTCLLFWLSRSDRSSEYLRPFLSLQLLFKCPSLIHTDFVVFEVEYAELSLTSSQKITRQIHTKPYLKFKEGHIRLGYISA